jgi:hypothetical protein
MKIHPALVAVLACFAIPSAIAQGQDAASQIPAAPFAFYHNLQYGFCFRAPWSYSIVDQTWSGTLFDTQEKVSGPELIIRNREWSKEDPWQDIPIMIFTLSQWNLVEAGKLAVSAAPIGPSELGRTANYVFALPPRWIGFTEVEGQDAVEESMKQHPFQAPCAPVVYRNAQYGFCVLLPADWKGFTVIRDKWGGGPMDHPNGPPIQGPELTFRNPKWTRDAPYQDIPIMIFTRAQWRLADNYVFSAAPIGPGDIGRNSRYVLRFRPDGLDMPMSKGKTSCSSGAGSTCSRLPAPRPRRLRQSSAPPPAIPYDRLIHSASAASRGISHINPIGFLSGSLRNASQRS